MNLRKYKFVSRRAFLISLLIFFQINLFLLYNSFTFTFFTFFSNYHKYSQNQTFMPQRINSAEFQVGLPDAITSDRKFGNFLLPEYENLLKNDQNDFFLIEPFLLGRELRSKLSEDEYEEFKWRFDLPQEFRWKRNSLTVGLMVKDLEKRKNYFLKNISPDIQIAFGPNGPFDKSNSSITHLFYRIPSQTNPSKKLHLQVVVFYTIKNFLWTGRIPPSLQLNLTDREQYTPDASFNIENFGETEQIFDSFKMIKNENGILIPDDSRHFLSQMSTSTYIHCPVERQMKWFKENNQTINRQLASSSDKAIANFKNFTRHLEMHFWMACGTLLGWYRQCHITPFTTDIDFASWPKYLKGKDPKTEYQNILPQYNLEMARKFGEPSSTMEFTFWSKPDIAQIDLFFMYRNETHFLLPTHTPPIYWYSAYPKFSLCSGELLGHKVLVPCTPLSTIVAEYGRTWSQPIEDWNYFAKSPNIHNMGKFPFNISQNELFRPHKQPKKV